MFELTEVQKKALNFILSHIEETGVPPTLREIAAYFRWKAVGSAQDVVAALRRKGALASTASGKARQIIPSPKLFQAADNEVPLLGYVQAGAPTLALGGWQDSVHFPAPSNQQRCGGELFALIVDGYSMLHAGFLPGDHILVEQSPTAHDKDIVVACVNHNEVTVKRYAQKGSSLYQAVQIRHNHTHCLPPAYLVPENPDFAAIPFGENEGDRMIGIVRSLYRKNVV